MTAFEKQLQKDLEKRVKGYVKDIEKAAKKDKLRELLENSLDVKITIDGEFHYLSAVITFGIGGVGYYLNTDTGMFYGVWSSIEICRQVDRSACKAVDDYFQKYYENCR